MKPVLITFGIIFTIIFAALALFISSMVHLVGMGKDFWSVGIVQFAGFFGIAALLCWMRIAVLITSKNTTDKQG